MVIPPPAIRSNDCNELQVTNSTIHFFTSSSKYGIDTCYLCDMWIIKMLLWYVKSLILFDFYMHFVSEEFPHSCNWFIFLERPKLLISSGQPVHLYIDAYNTYYPPALKTWLFVQSTKVAIFTRVNILKKALDHLSLLYSSSRHHRQTIMGICEVKLHNFLVFLALSPKRFHCCFFS